MEHLVYNPSARVFRSEIRATRDGSLDVPDWQAYDRDYGPCLQLEPGFPWFGHDHTASSYFHQPNHDEVSMAATFFDMYNPAWDLEEMLRSDDIQCAHPSLQNMDLPTAIHQVAAYIQSWLYLGLLESVCDRPIAVSRLVRTNSNGQACLYSRSLPVLLENWIRPLASQKNVQRETLIEAKDCVLTASTILDNILSHSSRSSSSSAFKNLRTLILSFEPALSALFEALVRTAEVHLNDEIRALQTPEDRELKPYSDNLVLKGWCPFVIASAEITMGPALLRFVDIARFANTSTGHDDCTAHECKRNNIQVETYAQSHWPSTCHCRYVKPNIKTVLEILDAGYIPIICFDPSTSSIELGSVHPEEQKNYIAFSHVWADGLGSDTETGLPLCQIRRLHQLASQRVKNAAFWIDSLCIPRRRRYRKKAIEMMKYTYQIASSVIILDSGLQTLSISNSDIEVAWSVSASGWVGRLWTYQEGFLPRRVTISVRDGLVDIDPLIQRLHQLYYHPTANPIPTIFIRDLLAMLQKIRPLERHLHEKRKSKRIVDVFNAMTRRQSSRLDDQLLVISLSLDLDLSAALAPNGENKWRTFYMRLGEIPWTVIFDRRPKMQLRFFTWAPSSWISHGKDEWLRYEEAPGEITKQGLKVKLTVLMLEHAISTEMSCVLVDLGQERYEISRPNMAEEPKIRHFNFLVVRHLEDEHPRDALQGNSSILSRVGVGFRDEATAPQASHDFVTTWEVWAMDESVDARETVEDILTGCWETVDVFFV